jgi:hypothetical protein
VVVICPACGPASSVRYCKKEHLYEDIQRHWVYECGKKAIREPIDGKTIRARQFPPRPYMVGNGHNLIERHRQAVYRAMEEADYFIFKDIEKIDSSIMEPTKEEYNIVRGTGDVVLQIIFPDDMTSRSRRQMFNHHINLVLKLGNPMAHRSCVIALHLIREALILAGNWTDEILDYLCMQVAGEWGGFRVPPYFYNVAEVNALWQGARILPAMPVV